MLLAALVSVTAAPVVNRTTSAPPASNGSLSTAEITNGDQVITLTENQSTYIPLGAVHRLVQFRIANAADYNPDAKQTISINFKLDLKQLPRPLQIGAAGQSDWNISFSKTQRLELTP